MLVLRGRRFRGRRVELKFRAEAGSLPTSNRVRTVPFPQQTYSCNSRADP